MTCPQMRTWRRTTPPVSDLGGIVSLPMRLALASVSGIIDEDPRTSVSMGGAMAKFHSRPSAQYRYEHYDPKA
jgi:hypothetical protein